MKVLNQLKSNLWNVELSEKDVEEIERYVDLDEIDVEIWAGENVLENQTLFKFYSRLNRLKNHSQTTAALVEELEKICLQNIK